MSKSHYRIAMTLCIAMASSVYAGMSVTNGSFELPDLGISNAVLVASGQSAGGWSVLAADGGTGNFGISVTDQNFSTQLPAALDGDQMIQLDHRKNVVAYQYMGTLAQEGSVSLSASFALRDLNANYGVGFHLQLLTASGTPASLGDFTILADSGTNYHSAVKTWVEYGVTAARVPAGTPVYAAVRADLYGTGSTAILTCVDQVQMRTTPLLNGSFEAPDTNAVTIASGTYQAGWRVASGTAYIGTKASLGDTQSPVPVDGDQMMEINHASAGSVVVQRLGRVNAPAEITLSGYFSARDLNFTSTMAYSFGLYADAAGSTPLAEVTNQTFAAVRTWYTKSVIATNVPAGTDVYVRIVTKGEAATRLSLVDALRVSIVSSDELKPVFWLDATDVDGDGVSEGAGEDGLSGGAVASWVDKSGGGYDVAQTNAAKRPAHHVSGFGSRSTAYLVFDGVDDYLVRDPGLDFFRYLDTKGAIVVVLSTTNAARTQLVFGLSDTADNRPMLSFGTRGQDGSANGELQVIARNNATGTYVLKGNESLADDKLHIAFLESDGSGWSMYDGLTAQSLSAVIGTNTGDWFGTLPGFRRMTVGCWAENLTAYADMKLVEIRVYRKALSAADRQAVYEELWSKYGPKKGTMIAVW